MSHTGNNFLAFSGSDDFERDRKLEFVYISAYVLPYYAPYTSEDLAGQADKFCLHSNRK